MTQNQQENDNVPPMSFNAMLLDSYESTQNAHVGQPTNEEFSFPFSQEPDIHHDEMFSFHNDNQNTYNIQNRKEPLTDGIPPRIQTTPPDLRVSNNLAPIRAPYGGQQNQNQAIVRIIMKNLAWSTAKYSAVEELK